MSRLCTKILVSIVGPWSSYQSYRLINEEYEQGYQTTVTIPEILRTILHTLTTSSYLINRQEEKTPKTVYMDYIVGFVYKVYDVDSLWPMLCITTDFYILRGVS